jgi:hypothetical protein
MLNRVYRETGVAVVPGVAEKGGDADRTDARGYIFVQTFGSCERVEPADAGQGWPGATTPKGKWGMAQPT